MRSVKGQQRKSPRCQHGLWPTGIPLLVVRTTPIPQRKDLFSSQVALGCIHAVLALIAAFQRIAVIPLRQIGCGCVGLLQEAEQQRVVSEVQGKSKGARSLSAPQSSSQVWPTSACATSARSLGRDWGQSLWHPERQRRAFAAHSHSTQPSPTVGSREA
jgi:hypothetical protein